MNDSPPSARFSVSQQFFFDAAHTLRREIEAAGAQLLEVQHASLVTLQLRLPAAQADAFVQRINDQGQGRVGWPASTD